VVAGSIPARPTMCLDTQQSQSQEALLELAEATGSKPGYCINIIPSRTKIKAVARNYIPEPIFYLIDFSLSKFTTTTTKTSVKPATQRR
jgi:hypothetical protein